MHGVGSRNKLTPSHARLYPGDGLLDRIGRAVCVAECLPRKEVHEAWEMATRVCASFDVAGVGRVVDVACGYGLLAQVIVLLEPRVADAVAVDVRLAPNHRKIHAALCAHFPALIGRVRFEQRALRDFVVEAGDLVVSAHACGGLSYDVIAAAVAGGARVAVLPCCHQFRFRDDLDGVADKAAAIDAERVAGLVARGYAVHTLCIPEDVSPKNRLLVAAPGVS